MLWLRLIQNQSAVSICANWGSEYVMDAKLGEWIILVLCGFSSARDAPLHGVNEVVRRALIRSDT